MQRTQLTGADTAAHAGFLSVLREMVRLQSWLTNGFISLQSALQKMHDLNQENDNPTLRQSGVDVAVVLQHGMDVHKSGRLTDAEAIYRQILATAPRHFEALYLLGIIEYQRGNYDS